MNGKDVKVEFRKIRKMALNKKVNVNQKRNGHQEWDWEMINDDGDTVKCKVTQGNSPSCYRWRKNHHANIRKVFRDLNISGYQIR